MDELEIKVFDEIKDYKEKIYFFNFRQWIFAILIVIIVVPTYIILKDKIGEEITSYIVIAIAGVLGFIGFVKIHELPAEKILPYWFRHFFLFAKPIPYMTDKEFAELNQKKSKKNTIPKQINNNSNIKEMKKLKKQEKLLEKAKKKNEVSHIDTESKEEKQEFDNTENELKNKLSKLSKEQQDALLKLLER